MRIGALCLAALFSALALGETGPTDLDLLRAENDMLKRKVQRLEKRIADLEVELRSAKAGPAVVPKASDHKGKTTSTKEPPQCLGLAELVKIVERAEATETTELQRSQILTEAKGQTVGLDCIVRNVRPRSGGDRAQVEVEAETYSTQKVIHPDMKQRPKPMVELRIIASVPEEQARDLRKSQQVRLSGKVADRLGLDQFQSSNPYGAKFTVLIRIDPADVSF